MKLAADEAWLERYVGRGVTRFWKRRADLLVGELGPGDDWMLGREKICIINQDKPPRWPEGKSVQPQK